MIKTVYSREWRSERYLSMIKTVYSKPTDNINVNGENLKAFPLMTNKTRLSTLPTPIQSST